MGKWIISKYLVFVWAFTFLGKLCKMHIIPLIPKKTLPYSTYYHYLQIKNYDGWVYLVIDRVGGFCWVWSPIHPKTTQKVAQKHQEKETQEDLAQLRKENKNKEACMKWAWPGPHMRPRRSSALAGVGKASPSPSGPCMDVSSLLSQLRHLVHGQEGATRDWMV